MAFLSSVLRPSPSASSKSAHLIRKNDTLYGALPHTPGFNASRQACPHFNRRSGSIPGEPCPPPKQHQRNLHKSARSNADTGNTELIRKSSCPRTEKYLTAIIRARGEELLFNSDVFRDTATRVAFLQSDLPSMRHDLCSVGFRQLISANFAKRTSTTLMR